MVNHLGVQVFGNLVDRLPLGRLVNDVIQYRYLILGCLAVRHEHVHFDGLIQCQRRVHVHIAALYRLL